MQNIYRSTLLIMLMISASSCLERTESIAPIAPIKTMAEIQREAMMQQAIEAGGNTELSQETQSTLEESKNDPSLYFLNIKYSLEDMDLSEAVDLGNSYEILGNSLLRTFAKIFVALKGTHEIDMDEIEVPLPDLNLDFNVIKSIKIKRLYLTLNPAYVRQAGPSVNFSFIESLQFNKPQVKTSAFSYKKTASCAHKCIEFQVNDGDFYNALSSGHGVWLKPTLFINALPKRLDYHLDGQIEIQIGLRLPF